VPSGAIWNNVLKVGTAKIFLKNKDAKQHLSGAILNNVLEVGTAEKILKAKTPNGAF